MQCDSRLEVLRYVVPPKHGVEDLRGGSRMVLCGDRYIIVTGELMRGDDPSRNGCVVLGCGPLYGAAIEPVEVNVGRSVIGCDTIYLGGEVNAE